MSGGGRDDCSTAVCEPAPLAFPASLHLSASDSNGDGLFWPTSTTSFFPLVTAV